MPPLKDSQKLIVIAGPTASGKTATAVALAGAFGTEIVSADSRQIYREMTIGTAVPDAAELAAVRHHFIQTRSVLEPYDAAQYGEEAVAVLQKLFERYDHAVLCGGSGLYIRAVLEGFDDIPAIGPAVRQEIIASYDQMGLSWLQSEVRALDPDIVSHIDMENPHRLIRALEVVRGTGQSIVSFRRRKTRNLPWTVVRIALDLPREELYERISSRLDAMIDAGLFDEARALYPHRTHPALQTVGYQEIFGYLDGAYGRDEAIRLMKRNTRRYAKRQLTWFRADPRYRWFHPSEVAAMESYIRGFTDTTA